MVYNYLVIFMYVYECLLLKSNAEFIEFLFEFILSVKGLIGAFFMHSGVDKLPIFLLKVNFLIIESLVEALFDS